MTFTMAEPPASGLPSPSDVTVPQTSVVALLVTAGSFRHELHTSLVRTMLYDSQQNFGNYRGELIHTSGANISHARNDLFRRFLDETDCEWAWLLDSDMDVPQETLPRLLCAAAVSGAKVIGGLCVMVGSDGPIPTIYQLGDHAAGEVTRVMLDYPENTIVQCAATGAACLLVHRSVVEHFRDAHPDLNYPWFYEDQITGQWVSEDILFTLRCNEAGFPVYVDCTSPIGHVKGSTVWWPKHIREGKGFPPAKTYAVIPSKTAELAEDTLEQLADAGLEHAVILDNTDDGSLANLASSWVHVIPMPGAGIHEMWNTGIDWCAEHADQRRNVNLLVLNDDLRLGPRFVTRMVEALRSDGDLVAVSGNYDQRTGELVEMVDDICAGRYDGTGGFAGFAFAAKGEWFGSGYRFPEDCKWWYGDNDLVLAVRATGVGKMGIAVDAHVEHLDGGSKTGGDWSAYRHQLELDRQAFEARWAAINQPAQPATSQTVDVISAIYGGYDEPCPLVLQAGVSEYLMISDSSAGVGVGPWKVRIDHYAGEDPRYSAKRAKYQPFNYTDADIVVWLDGRVQTVNPGFVSWLIDCLGDDDMALYRHPTRSSILDEAEGAHAEDANRPPKYEGRDLVAQAKHYLTDDYDDVNLWQTTFYVARRNERTLELGRRWQEEQDRFPDCLLDQIPFAPLVAECGVKVADLPGGFWSQHGRLFVLRPHIDGT